MNETKFKKISLLILYAILLVISSVATGESLARTLFDTSIASRLSFYFVSFVVLGALYSVGIIYIKKAIEERDNTKSLFLVISFVFLWMFLSVWTNTHSFYIQQNMSEIRRNELSNVHNQLVSLQANPIQELINMESVISDSVRILNGALRDQIRDPNNCGVGTIANELIDEIQKLLGGRAITSYKNIGNCKTLADSMYNQVDRRLEERLLRLQQPRREISNLFNSSPDYAPILTELKENVDYYEVQPNSKIKNLLRRSYGIYNELQTQVRTIFNTPLFGELGRDRLQDIERQIATLPRNVASIELENIGNLWWYAKNHGTNNSSLIWALILAISVDMVSFIVYFASLNIKNNNSW